MKTNTKTESGPQVRCDDLLEVLRRYWKSRVVRLAYDESQAAHKGDYGKAARKAGMKEATELCLQDLKTEGTSNDSSSATGGGK